MGKAPLVTCIMPTADRRSFVPRAIGQFLRQDYPERELLILDDGGDRVEDLVSDDPRIRYAALTRRMTLGAKRNLACEMSKGVIVVHWDDDDWMSDTRLTRQVAALRTTGADVCGVSRLFLCNPETRRAWRYVYPAGERPWLAGNTLCYTRAFWQRNPFPHVREGEDALFLWTPLEKKIHDMDDALFCVAIIHAGNTSFKRTTGPRYHPVPFDRLLRMTGDLTLRRPPESRRPFVESGGNGRGR
jgi:glycosyltransferase involved in cell wall biosynthesis